MRHLGGRTFIAGAIAAALAIPATASADCGDGGIAWVRGLASSKSVSLTAIAASTDGGVVAAGEFNDALEVTGAAGKAQSLPGGKEKAGFILKLSPKGEVAWMRRFTGMEWVKGLAVAKDGTVIVAGSTQRAVTFEGPPGAKPLRLPGEGTRYRLFLAFYGPDGTPRGARVGAENAGTNFVGMQGFALLGETVAITGRFSGDVWFGSGAGRIKLTAGPQGDTFAATLKLDGAAVWALRVSADSQTSPGKVAFAADGSVLVTGTFRGSNKPGATFGQSRAIVLRQTGDSDAFVARVNPAGKMTWARAIGGDERNRDEKIPGVIMMPATEAITAAVPAAGGDLLLVGLSPFPVRFGPDKPLRSAGYSGSFLARLSPSGQMRAATSIGTVQVGNAAPLPGGDLMIVGNLVGIGTLSGTGGKPVSLTAAGHDDLLVARIAPDGGLRWARRLGGIGFDSAIDLVADTAGTVTLAARFGKDLQLGPEGCRPLHAGPDDGHQIFLLRLTGGAMPSDEARESRLAAARAQASALRKTAMQAFKAKRYAAACDAYAKLAATVPAPDDAAAVADLALCLQRLGKKDEAIAANRRAIALGANDDHSDWGDDAARRHAYFNLGKLGVTVDLPQGCGPLPPAPGCNRSLWACVDTIKENDSHGGSSHTDWVRVGISKDEAAIATDDTISLVMPSLGRVGLYESVDRWALTNNFTSRRPHVDVLLGEEVEEICTRDGCESPGDEPLDCDVVYANACLGLVGVVCPGAGEGRKGRPRDAVDEFYLGPENK
jgi:hypothetical protein